MRRIFAVGLALLAVVSPAAAQLRVTTVVSGLTNPVAFVQDPSDPAVQFVVEQGGRIRVVRNGSLLPVDFLDLSSVVSAGGERGLLGLAFPPDGGITRRLYVNFTNTAGDTVVVRFKRSAGNPAVADPVTRFDLRWPSGQRFIAQPFANHNGGNLTFGPDGYLYIGLGDGGSGNDPAHNAQNPAVLLGKMLRIDVSVPESDPEGYDVPADNPFVSRPGTLPEIWAFGLRNPWRYSFDDPARGGTGALVIGDVGQSAREEIDYEPAGRGGRNYGWRNREGTASNVTTLPPAYFPLQDPIHEYDHASGISVTGGYVYRGTELGPAFRGRYFFADLTGRVWSLGLSIAASGDAAAAGVIEHTNELGGAAPLGQISSFGIDAGGELYIVSYSTGRVLRIAGPAAAASPAMSIDTPRSGTRVSQPFVVAGWAIDAASASDAGVSTVHVWAYPNPGSAQPPVFLGVASFAGNRPDVGAAFGARFAPSGFGLTVRGLAPGAYRIVAFAFSTVSGTFNHALFVDVVVDASARMSVDAPASGTSAAQPFVVAGWALDQAAATGTGVDTVHVWAYPNPGSGAPPTFLGVASMNGHRPDVGAAFGAQFTDSGYGLRVAGLSPGRWQIVVFAHSTVTGSFNNAQAITVDVR